MKVKVTALQNNQYVLETEDKYYFQSYNTIIAEWDKNTGQVTLDPKYDVSRTTSKYLAKFLNRDMKEIRKRIKDGVYKVSNLNT